MANKRISNEKQVFILAALAEGTPINAICRMFGVGKNGVLRVIEETGEALNAYMRTNFRNLCCERIEMDEQWQYVGMHGRRMEKKEVERGDFWLWCAIDPDTKLVFSHLIGNRRSYTAESFVEDVAKRVVGQTQITTDGLSSYEFAIRGHFGDRASYATEAKVFDDADQWNDKAARQRQKGIPKTKSADRKAVFGSPNLSSSTTSHIERVFLTMRQELARFTRCTLAYSKDLRMHKLATALNLGIYNLVRKHTSLGGMTPAQAAGVEVNRWTLEDVVALTERYFEPKRQAEKAAKSIARRAKEDAMFANL